MNDRAPLSDSQLRCSTRTGHAVVADSDACSAEHSCFAGNERAAVDEFAIGIAGPVGTEQQAGRIEPWIHRTDGFADGCSSELAFVGGNQLTTASGHAGGQLATSDDGTLYRSLLDRSDSYSAH